MANLCVMHFEIFKKNEKKKKRTTATTTIALIYYLLLRNAIDQEIMNDSVNDEIKQVEATHSQLQKQTARIIKAIENLNKTLATNLLNREEKTRTTKICLDSKNIADLSNERFICKNDFCPLEEEKKWRLKIRIQSYSLHMIW